jgi:hypothetical protein
MRATTPARSFLAVAAALVAGLAPGVSAEARMAPTSFRVTASLSTQAVRAGHSATIGGSVAPARPGATVYLQQERFGNWTTIGTKLLNRASSYSFTVTPRGAGTKYYRVLKLRQGAVGRAISPVRKLHSYDWFRFDQLQFLARDGIFFDSKTIAGTIYSTVMYSTLTGLDAKEVGVLDLSGQCRRVRGTEGITSGSDPNAVAEIAISTDGTPPQRDAQFDATTSEALTLGVRGVQALRVVFKNGSAAVSEPAIANGAALCDFDGPPVLP